MGAGSSPQLWKKIEIGVLLYLAGKLLRLLLTHIHSRARASDDFASRPHLMRPGLFSSSGVIVPSRGSLPNSRPKWRVKCSSVRCSRGYPARSASAGGREPGAQGNAERVGQAFISLFRSIAARACRPDSFPIHLRTLATLVRKARRSSGNARRSLPLRRGVEFRGSRGCLPGKLYNELAGDK